MAHNDAWPRFYPAEVTTRIVARSGITAGYGEAKLFRVIRSNTPGRFDLDNVPTSDDPDFVTVLTRSTSPIAVGTKGFVSEDGRGSLWWFDTQSDLIRFTLYTDLNPSDDEPATAQANINSDGDDDGDEIDVTAWSKNTGKAGDRGIAWRYSFENEEDETETTYYIIELVSESTNLVRFTLYTDLNSTDTTAQATINSDGDDDGDEIEVTAWSKNTGKAGDHGIAWRYTFDDETTYYIIELSESTKLIRFTLYTALTDASTTAAATINSSGDDDGTLIAVTAWGKSRGLAGDRGIAWQQDDYYWVIELTSGIDATAFELTANAAYGAFGAVQSIAAIKLLPDGSPGITITVKTMGRTRALSGCRGVAIQRGTDYVAIEIQQPAAAISANLYEDCRPSAETIYVRVSDVITPFPADFPPGASVLQVDNPLSQYGYSGTLCVLHYDATKDRYYLAHIRRQATRVVGLLESDFDAGDTTCTLGTLEGLDGVLPDELESIGQVTVENTHKWEGKAENRARAEYNWTSQKWELYQIDCAEDQGVPTETSPVSP